MNIYLLVEGRRTEKVVYSSWLLGAAPNLRESFQFDDIGDGHSLYCFSGEGFPAVLDIALPSAVRDIRAVGAYDALVLVFDCDDNESQDLQGRVTDIVREAGGLPEHTELVVVIQKRCIETWLLGNRRFVPRTAQSNDLIECKRFFDVTRSCPEQMQAPSSYDHSVSAFHYHYLRAAFRERRLIYTKARPSEAASPAYLDALRERYEDGDLSHMAPFFSFLDKVVRAAG